MRRTHLALLLVVAVLLLFYLFRGLVSESGVGVLACGRAITVPFRATADFFKRLGFMYTTAEEVERLRRELEKCRVCARVERWSPQYGEVVFRPVNEWWEKLYVKGTFPKGAVVVDLEGNLVGRVVDSHLGISEVKLITSSDEVFSGEVGNSLGVCVGSGKELLVVKYVSPKREIYFGEEVLTAGIDGVFPKGLRVGEVSRCYKSPDSISFVVEVLPSADLFDIRKVVVLRFGEEDEDAFVEDQDG